MSARTAAKSGSAARRIARAQAAAAKTAGLPLDKVVVHNHLIGGGFGRRLEVDGVVRAVQIAQQVDGPVKVVWTREEDIQHDMYRPYWFDRCPPVSMRKACRSPGSHRFAGSSVIARWLPPAFNNGLDPDTHRRRDRSGLCPAEHARRVSAGGAAGHSDRLLAQRRAVAQCLRDRKLHRRTGGGGEAGSGRLSAGSSRQVAPRQGRARACRGKGRLGTAVARAGRPRRLPPVRLRDLYGAGRRSRSVEGWRGSCSARRLRGRLRHRRQSRHRARRRSRARSSSASRRRSTARSRSRTAASSKPTSTPTRCCA